VASCRVYRFTEIELTESANMDESWHSALSIAPTIDESIEDVFVVVLGVTGAGKSTFVSLCSGQQAEIGDSLESCTKEVESFTFMYSDKIRVHLVDSPGFDDTNKSDADVLKDISNWMASSYKEKNQLLSGILMLHRVSDPRMTGGSMRNLQMFQKLCGPECFQVLTIATTFWSNPPEAKQAAAEKELCENYWSDMLNQGATYVRHQGGIDSARLVLDVVIGKRKQTKTRIQAEMVDQGLDLNETSAGLQLSRDLIDAKTKHEQDLRDLQANHQAALSANDQSAASRYAGMEQSLNMEIKEAISARKKLETTIARLQLEKKEEMDKAEERLKQQFRNVNERQKQLKTKLRTSEKERAAEKAELEKELGDLKKNLESAGRKKACRPTKDDDGSAFESWIHKGLTLIGKMLGLIH
jgi:GTP-binding protein EngB required for normal cell division